MNPIKEILIVHTWGLGDMILLTPVLNAVSAIYPEVRFSYLIFPGIAAEPVKRRTDTGSLWLANRDILSLLRMILTLRKQHFHAVMLSSGVRPWKAWLFIYWLKAGFKVLEIHGHRFPGINRQLSFNSSFSRTESNYLLLSSVLDLPDWSTLFADQHKYRLLPSFPLAQEHLEFAHGFLRKCGFQDGKVTIVHPGCMAKNKYRRWNKVYFAELVKMIQSELEHRVIVVSGPDELDVAAYLCQVCKTPMLHEKNLANVAAVLSLADYFINTDSGIGHLASCFNIRMLTIFGPGDERQTAPFSNLSRIVRKPCDCAPCVGRKRIPCEVTCLNNLTPKEVFTAFKEILA